MEAELTRIDYSIAVHQLGLMKALAAYDPHIAGTPPLGIHTETSDIDILLCAPEPEAFVADVSQFYEHMSGFHIWQWTSEDRPVVATFRAYGWISNYLPAHSPLRSSSDGVTSKLSSGCFRWEVTALEVRY